MIKEVYSKIKKYIITILSIILCIILFIPLVLAYFYIKQQGKSIQIHPEFKIIDCKKEDIEVLSESVEIAKEILNKVQK
jgi:hypothetical protein